MCVTCRRLLGVAVVLVVAACSSDDGTGSAPLDDRDLSCLDQQVDSVADRQFVGRSEAEAASAARAAGLEVRIVGRDGTCLGHDDDLRLDRINFVVSDGEVVAAARY